ncbi:oxidoreductase domain-containing protein [Natrialba hulunbeirensis JCM 10989]|uniref:Oxidoreductase domain-containing protein n=1 Tax=Natrialba hulunbeirensis JCM 10989 TaxID=1227493 RepID=M0AAZ9_9EURY|nr:Gfo/Idh/MocA family oxidoreductase [Natrialba hulunbeirensis]ELY95037.1 oxidoreductase domain-containing protein [Natrialba hulunbeirensis JCM 10989]
MCASPSPSTSSSTPIRVGIVGLGYIGTTVGGQLHRHDDATIEAVCDLDLDQLESVGNEFGVPPARRYTEYDSMLADANGNGGPDSDSDSDSKWNSNSDSEPGPDSDPNLDAVLIATPHTLHYEQVVAALESDLHVYCDKPLTTDLEHARDLVERAAHTDLTLMVGYQRHLQTAFQLARDRFESGPPQWVTASITQDWIADSQGTWRLDPDLSGGGFLSDTGSHVLDGILWTTGLEPASVTASMDFHDDEQRVDSRAHLDIRFENGATGTVSLHGDLPSTREHIHCWDDDGALYIEGTQWGSRDVFEIETDASERLPYIDHRREQTRADAFVESIHNGPGHEPPAAARDALRVTALTEAAYEAARTGERVSVGLE